MTLSTCPGVVPLCSRSSSSWQASRGPCATTWTRPSSLLEAKPVSPNSSARERVHQRNPTPWTRPCTQAVSRTSANSCITDLKRHFGTGFERAARRAHLIDGPFDDGQQPRDLVLGQAGQIELHVLLEKRVALLLAISGTRDPDVGLVVVAEAPAQRRVAAHPAAGGQRDLHQLAGGEDPSDVFGADEALRAARAAPGVAAHAGPLNPQFRHGLFLQP